MLEVWALLRVTNLTRDAFSQMLHCLQVASAHGAFSAERRPGCRGCGPGALCNGAPAAGMVLAAGAHPCETLRSPTWVHARSLDVHITAQWPSEEGKVAADSFVWWSRVRVCVAP